ncbi:MAG: glycosyl hydrolase [Prolixibacteraceae bacterium]|jgi:hypothetical protein|nr:glycosyl hydrolase [Prolixibacteraceae bacterium]
MSKFRYSINTTLKFPIRLFLILTLIAGASSVFAIDKEIVESVNVENIELTTPIEYHITNSENAITNSTISLNHVDAWLFFDNIRPSDVISQYLGSVKVNEQPFVNGGNGRVAIYGHGTVLMSHGSGFKPLTVFTKDNFEGETSQYNIHTYHNNLGGFNNAIKSFILKRGYMATFASSADGSGYSRVFIADTEDLEINQLQPELHGRTSFIRILKHQWVNKKGKSGWNPNDIGATSYYDWNIGGNTGNNYEYAAIRQNGGWPSWTAINSKQDISHLLGFNEPDRPDQSYMTMNEMISQWPDFMKSGLRIGSPAFSGEWNEAPGGGNVFDFVEQCDELGYRVDFVAVHCYWVKSPQQWYNDLKYIYERTGRPLWITEWNNGANWTTEWWPDSDRSYTTANAQKQLNDMKGILEVLDTAHFVERYFIYDWVQDCRAMVLNGEPTLAGEYYASKKSPIGYNGKNEVIPARWKYSEPVINYRYLSLPNSIRLSWENPNGDLAKEIVVEKRVNDGEYQVLKTLSDNETQFYLDSIDNTINGRISYRMKLKTIYDDYITSNTVSYYQTGGDQALQHGYFPLNNSEWETFLFSKHFEESPIIVTGATSFNNILGLTSRVNSVSERSFKFHLEPWNYIVNKTFNKTDYLGAIALRGGSCNLGDIKAEAAEITDVGNEWVTVSFEQPFDTIPAVFCTQISNSTFVPTTPVVQNVSKEGFELKIKCEEALSGTVIKNEKVHYLAVEPGSGVINGKRITVGYNGDDESGISTTPFVVSYDETYEEPLLFAQMQTDNNNFASTLRYTKDESAYNIYKHREMSGQLSSMQDDKLAWMVMDISDDQPVSANKTSTLETFSIYPNPTAEIVYLYLASKMKVEIFDIKGNLLKTVSSDKGGIDISNFPAGVYLLKVEGYSTQKLIKE